MFSFSLFFSVVYRHCRHGFVCRFIHSQLGLLLQNVFRAGAKLQTAADVLICSNVAMIVINVITVNISVFWGLSLSILSLVAALLLTFRLESRSDEPLTNLGLFPQELPLILKPLILLCLFIFIITINSGLMYQVVTPALPIINFWPAITGNTIYVLLILKITGQSKPGLHTLCRYDYDRSFLHLIHAAGSIRGQHLIIDTLMLGAGVCDLFWWSILGNVLVTQ